MFYPILIALYVLVCTALVVVVLLQSGKGEGLAGVFGGGTGQAIFGARTGDILTKSTTILAVLFMILSLALFLLSAHSGATLSEEIAEYTETSEPAAPAPAD